LARHNNLLNQPGAPLVIDQPEIWAAKERRQLIFASHNANLVVNGDAELVVCCDYRDAGDHSAGVIKLEGAIDIPGVRDEITMVMEGGEKAFRFAQREVWLLIAANFGATPLLRTTVELEARLCLAC
jgi:type III restriction enzyme